MKNALTYEERVYRELYHLLGNFMPQMYATFRYKDWHCLVLEDLGPKSVPPWSTPKARAITYALADFHQASAGATLPEWLAHPANTFGGENWAKTAQESDGFHKIAEMVGEDSAQALKWFQNISPTIERLLVQADFSVEPHTILHGDLRSDNLRFSKNRLALFDWPAITRGRPEWDIVGFAQSVAVEGGPFPEEILNWYQEKTPLENAAIESALAWCLTLFANRAWRPEIPGLPRLRRFQRQQLGMVILWIARHLSQPTPSWAGILMR
jgi:fructosamine-3-kinase